MQVFGITEKKWKTAIEITDNPRGLKKKVRAFNNNFGKDNEHQVYVISGSKGYRLTTSKDEIMESIEREERLAKIRFKQASERRKAAREYFSSNERLPL